MSLEFSRVHGAGALIAPELWLCLCSVCHLNIINKKGLIILLNSILQLDCSKYFNYISTVVKCIWFCVRNSANTMSTLVHCECTILLVILFHHIEMTVASFFLCLCMWREKRGQRNPQGSGARLYCQKPHWHQTEWAPNSISCTFGKSNLILTAVHFSW